MKHLKIHLVAGARPNFMKVAPLYHQFKKQPWSEVVLIATGQHYSPELSDVFLKEFSLPKPHYHLGVGEGTAAEQLAKIISEYEKVLRQNRPDLVVVVGDVTSTLAGCLAAKRNQIKVAHVEAGLRSRDLSMPEEVNRIEVDKVADFLFTPSSEAGENLRNEGRAASSIFLVGNIMIDTYTLLKPQIELFIQRTKLPFSQGKFALVTLHRPSNVDEFTRLQLIVENLILGSQFVPMIFPVHPRTEKRLKYFNLWKSLEASSQTLKIMAPLGYIEFMSLLEQSLCVVTDSGGIQEETTYLNVPCFTVRKNSERPITLTHGSNQLVEPESLPELLKSCLSQKKTLSLPPELWDGLTAHRVVEVIKQSFAI
jgi:UDP-N-acetylglucosamine 2-epimerase (non-hydrolysing)